MSTLTSSAPPTKKRRIHGYTGDYKIEVRQRLPKSVVNCIVKATPSLQSKRGASISKNSSFIDNFFNSQSKQEWFRIGRRHNSWISPAMQHVKMVNNNDGSNTWNTDKNQRNVSSANDSILTGLSGSGFARPFSVIPRLFILSSTSIIAFNSLLSFIPSATDLATSIFS